MAVEEKPAEAGKEPEELVQAGVQLCMQDKWADIKPMIDEWVANKKYAVADMSSEEVAKDLGTNKRVLAAYFTACEQTTFRTWRTKLRIREAGRPYRVGGFDNGCFWVF